MTDTPLTDRISRHLRQLAPHMRDRDGVVLLEEAHAALAAEIVKRQDVELSQRASESLRHETNQRIGRANAALNEERIKRQEAERYKEKYLLLSAQHVREIDKAEAKLAAAEAKRDEYYQWHQNQLEATRKAEADKQMLERMIAVWKVDYEGQKFRGDKWMKDCQAAEADKRALVEALREMIDADTFCAGSGHDAKSRIRYAKAVTKALDSLKGAE